MNVDQNQILILSIATWSLVQLIRKHLWKDLDGSAVLAVALVIAVVLGYLMGIPINYSVLSMVLAAGLQQGLKALQAPNNSNPTPPEAPLNSATAAASPTKADPTLNQLESQISGYQEQVGSLQERLNEIEERLRF